MKNALYVNGISPEFAPAKWPERKRKERKKLRGHSPLLVCILANPIWEMVDNLCMRFEVLVN